MTSASSLSVLGRASRAVGASRGTAWASAPMIFAYIVLAFWILVLLAVQWIAPFEPLAAVGTRLSAPSAAHWFGTDSLGRDVLSRTLYGARESLPIALGAILGAVVVGCGLGAIAGFFGGAVDAVIMRVADITMAFPAILLAMAVAAGLGPGLGNALIAIIAVWWPIYARLTRGQVLSIKQREHVEAATAIGSGRWRTLAKHILPHSTTPILVNATMDLGQIILLVASLSFLGLGALPPSPEWGAMITDGSKNFYQPWIAAAPGLAMVTVTLAVNFLGDGLRDALDVKARRK
ncbi:peptide/nickel transport system permease protein [Glaciihabitans tibetensis]|uniref:Peptide/nickel transport system permease protein n=1 Tax=Glaciihabitans tibetensis TaxID=1266600 RepID=A0A2T0VAQ5_9MICO|nr:ABC transporter permease [Glaciihabitans tibetensis]PRY67276.1 peptide/nickel transport system permease protein [Glaciihabitans tibetensis]